jgi:predicted nucleotidyltransferase
MTKDEALKMAIDALLYGTDHTKAVKACKEALEQPTVAKLNDEYLRDTYVEGLNQPAWQGLTDDEITKVYKNSLIVHSDTHYEFNNFKFARAIEQASKDKNNVN